LKHGGFVLCGVKYMARRLEWGAHRIAALDAEKSNKNLPMTWRYNVATVAPSIQ